MTWQIGVVFLITVGTVFLFATERLRTDVLALSVLSVLGLLGIFWPKNFLTPDDVLSCFSNPAPLTVAAMFILGEGLTRTGAIEGIGNQLLNLADKGEAHVLFGMMLLATFVSAFINNTAVVAFFMPVVLEVCTKKKLAPSRLLIPLSYGSLFGGICTLIGTSTNIVVDGIARRYGVAPIRMFEPTSVGIFLSLTGIIYIALFGRRLLPARETLTTLIGSTPGKEFRTEIVVLPDSPLDGQWIGDIRKNNLRGGTILEIFRNGESIPPPYDKVAVEIGDRIVMNLHVSGVRAVQETPGIALLPEAELGIEQLQATQSLLVESIVPINSPLIGKSLRDLNFAHKHDVRILAMHRHGMSVRDQFEAVPLLFGDTLLLQGPAEALEFLRDDRALLLLSPMRVSAVRRHKRWLALGIVAATMIAASIGTAPVALLALAGSLALVLTRCLDMNEAYEAVNWNIIMLIAGLLGLGLAMEKTGGAVFVAGALNAWLGGFGPRVALSGTYFVSMVLTEMISNKAVAALMTPIAIASAHAMGCDPRPFVFAVMFAGSASFATPVGYQTNTMIYGAGGYKFMDYFKIGAPLNLLFWIISSLLIPVVWPLR